MTQYIVAIRTDLELFDTELFTFPTSDKATEFVDTLPEYVEYATTIIEEKE